MKEMQEQYEIIEQKQVENMKNLYNKEIKLNILKDLHIDKPIKKELKLTDSHNYQPKKETQTNSKIQKDKKESKNN
jgi:hypothetical protein